MLFDTLLYTDDWGLVAAKQAACPSQDLDDFHDEVPFNGTKGPGETAAPKYQNSQLQKNPAVAPMLLLDLSCISPTDINMPSDNSEPTTQLRSNSTCSKMACPTSNQSSRESTSPTTSTPVEATESAGEHCRDTTSERKTQHCHTEKQYRARLNTSFDNLFRAIPQKFLEQSQSDCINQSRQNKRVRKGVVLDLARRYIEELEQSGQ